MSTFQELGVSDKICRGLSELGIHTPTEIQEKSLPVLIHQKTDFVGQAQTGTGKTVAFVVPVLERVDPANKRIQAVILCPTRELCKQNAKAVFKYSKYCSKVFVESVFGGEDIQVQIQRLSRPTQVLVATPGRLVELMNKGVVDLSGIHQFILDEADEILAMGFKKEIDRILTKTNDFRKIWLFSATIPHGLQEVISTYMAKGAPSVRVGSKAEVINPLIEHQYILCEKHEKSYMLTAFLKAMGNARGIIFVRTKGDAKTVNEMLVAKGFEADQLHGDLTQKERDKVMRGFVAKKFRLLVATDMAARGLDIDNLAFVVHYNLPDQAEFYTHRSGRTARAGKRGISIAFVTPQDMRKFKFLQEKLVIDFIQVT